MPRLDRPGSDAASIVPPFASGADSHPLVELEQQAREARLSPEEVGRLLETVCRKARPSRLCTDPLSYVWVNRPSCARPAGIFHVGWGSTSGIARVESGLSMGPLGPGQQPRGLERDVVEEPDAGLILSRS
jgi:hypothetical protein